MALYTLFDLTYRVARELGVVIEGVVTAPGTTTTTYSTTDLTDRFQDNYFNQGILWILYDYSIPVGATTLTGLPAPQGEWARITDFKSSTGMLTHSALTASTSLLDRFAIMSSEYTKDNLVGNINAVLSMLVIPTVDIVTVVTASDKTEYTLPLGMLDQNIKVWIQRSKTTNQNLWQESHDWYIAETSVWTVKKLIFRTQPVEPWNVKIEYWLPHPPLNRVTDSLSGQLNIDRVACEAALRCIIWKKAQKSVVDPALDFRTSELIARVERLKSRYPNRQPEIKLATLGGTDNFGGY